MLILQYFFNCVTLMLKEMLQKKVFRFLSVGSQKVCHMLRLMQQSDPTALKHSAIVSHLIF